MGEITFKQQHNGAIRNFELSNPSGGSDGYFVYIDRYYQGTIVKLKGEWVGHMNDRCLLTDEEIQALGKMVDEQSL